MLRVDVLEVRLEFTIPMRGNENCPGSWMSWVAASALFTIPMRGNELRVQSWACRKAVEVYDPHEG